MTNINGFYIFIFLFADSKIMGTFDSLNKYKFTQYMLWIFSADNPFWLVDFAYKELIYIILYAIIRK